MDRKVAIASLKHCEAEPYCRHYQYSGACGNCNHREALDLAIEALSAETPTDQQKHQLSEETPTNTPTDLISRADAIDRINGTGYAEQIKENLFFIIRSLPSAKVPTKCIAEIKIDADEVAQKIKEKYDLADRPSGEWIPCSERMPEDGQGVIICTDDNRFKDHPVGTCVYEDGRFHTNYRYDISMVAWMPLPKPYCPNCGAKMGGDEE